MKIPRTYLRPLRYSVQLGFFLLTLAIGHQFYQFVQHFEAPGHPFVQRPPSVDAFLPIGGLMAFKYFIMTGIVEPVHPAGFILFVAILAVSLIMKKGFCGWICPIGTLSQLFWMAGEKVFGRNFRIGPFTDKSLRSIKYVLLGLFLFLIGIAMPPNMMALFFIADYYKVVDVRMMKFFTEMTTVTLWVLIALAMLSLLYKNFWCRYLCPYGALLGLLSWLSPFKVRRNEEQCTHCHACTTNCPTLIDVESRTIVKSEECFGCLTCVSRCPAPGALDLSVSVGNKVGVVKAYLFPIILVSLLYLVIGIGIVADKWHSKVPYEDYQQLIPEVQKDYLKQ
ncbi:MAG TPA: 4Fe-4S binding protein [Nitrospirota bacterium]|nr:4Fe-4S binding protein [Nitrospirota bacterium]